MGRNFSLFPTLVTTLEKSGVFFCMTYSGPLTLDVPILSGERELTYDTYQTNSNSTVQWDHTGSLTYDTHQTNSVTGLRVDPRNKNKFVGLI